MGPSHGGVLGAASSPSARIPGWGGQRSEPRDSMEEDLQYLQEQHDNHGVASAAPQPVARSAEPQPEQGPGDLGDQVVAPLHGQPDAAAPVDPPLLPLIDPLAQQLQGPPDVQAPLMPLIPLPPVVPAMLPAAVAPVVPVVPVVPVQDQPALPPPQPQLVGGDGGLQPALSPDERAALQRQNEDDRALLAQVKRQCLDLEERLRQFNESRAALEAIVPQAPAGPPAVLASDAAPGVGSVPVIAASVPLAVEPAPARVVSAPRTPASVVSYSHAHAPASRSITHLSLRSHCHCTLRVPLDPLAPHGFMLLVLFTFVICFRLVFAPVVLHT